MSTGGSLFHFDDGRQSFEDLGQPNGPTHWRQSDLMMALNYQNVATFEKAMTRAKQACLSGWAPMRGSLRSPARWLVFADAVRVLSCCPQR